MNADQAVRKDLRGNDELLDTLPRDDRLAGRSALVTGASSGIGAAIARVLAASGALVAVSGRQQSTIDTVVAMITRQGGRAVGVPGDLSEPPGQVHAFADRARRALDGHVDILVNNAGIYPGERTEDLDDADLDALLATNIRAPHILVAELAPAMASRGSGAIINIGSWMARVGVPDKALYPATKAALEQLTRGWAAEYGPRGVRVNGVAPGATSTPGNADYPEAMAALTSGTPAGVPVRPIDIAWAVRYLASDEAAFMHGTSIDVDGGMVATRVG